MLLLRKNQKCFTLFSCQQYRPAWMIPCLVVGFLEMIFLALCITIVIPLCSAVFWEETKDFFTKLAQSWMELNTPSPKIIMSTLWTVAVLWLGQYHNFDLLLTYWTVRLKINLISIPIVSQLFCGISCLYLFHSTSPWRMRTDDTRILDTM